MYFPQHSAGFKKLLDGLRGKSVAVLGHLRPDGDCIGSQVGLTRVMRGLGVDVVAVNNDVVPRLLTDFVGDTPWCKASDYKPASGALGVCVDCADESRLGKTLRGMFPKPYIAVDHHLSNGGFAEHNFIFPEAAATAEVLAGMFFDTGIKPDAVTAQALYVGIATDTGQFRFPSTSPRVFRLCSELIAAGADPGNAARLLFERESPAKLRLLQAFLDSLRPECGGRAWVGVLRDADYAKTGAQREDSEGIVDYARSLDEADVGVFIEERDGVVKGSLRGKEPRMVLHRLAMRFGGGGHACAAGLNANKPFDVFYPEFIIALGEHLRAVDAGEFDKKNNA